MKRLLIWTALILLVSTLATSGCIFSDRENKDENTIALYGFSVKGEVFNELIIPAFEKNWSDETGKSCSFTTSYAGSGRITGQVINGAPAEVMILSTEWDALTLKKSGMVSTDWNTFPHNGTISTSPWVIMVRGGNPKGISDFNDLAEDDVEIIHADPVTSGGACWSIFSIYGSELRRTGSEKEAEKLLGSIIDNVISWQSSARAALSQFILGYGDALITYENDALLALEDGEDITIVYPQSTIFSEHKVVIVDRNVNDEEKDMVKDFVDFLYTPAVQGYFVENNFRPADGLSSDITPPIEDPFTVVYLGGWENAHERLIDGLYRDFRGM